MAEKKPTIPTLKRLPLYYNISKMACNAGERYISSASMAEQLDIDPTQVRKDIASIGYVGKPKVGFDAQEFSEHLRNFLGFDKVRNIILVGAGNLGLALAKYNGFAQYGLHIQAIFEKDKTKIGQIIAGKKVYSMDTLEGYILKNNVEIAILTIPAKHAQEVADILVSSGIKAIWNFAPVSLKVPKNVVCENQDLAANFITFAQMVD